MSSTPQEKVLMTSVAVKKKSFPERFIMGILGFLQAVLPEPILKICYRIDDKVEGAVSFFIKNYGKTKFMIAMSKKAQVLGIEKLWIKSPKAFVYFFLYYLIRDTILYIIIPIYLARLTTG